MSSDLVRQLWYRRGRVMPADLVAVILLVALTNLVVFLPAVNDHLVRVFFGIVFVLFVPGYALVAALFPEGRRPPTTSDTDGTEATVERKEPIEQDRWRRIDGIERVALSFGLSIAMVPLLMLGLTVTQFEFELVPVVLTISSVTVICTGIATIRRWALPEEQRFRVPYQKWIAAGKASVTDANSRFDAVLNVALAVAILLAVGTLAVAVAAPPDGEQYSEFYVLTENESGELIAADYPENFSPDESERLYVGIENYEQETVEYSVVVQLQRVESDGNESIVADRTEIDRFSITLAHNETFSRGQNIIVSDEITGEDLRLTFLLYDESVPETPTRDNAYRSLHLWVNVSESLSAGGDGEAEEE